MAQNVPEKMRAIDVKEPGGPEGLVVAEVDTPEPGAGEILIRVAAAGLNRADTLQSRGLYPPPPGASEILGLEVSGTVAAAGPGARTYKAGEEVCALLAGGGYAEYVAVHERQVLPVPDGVGLVEAASLPETYFTVWTNVFDRVHLRSGETFLVHGGSSGIGTTAILLASARGSRVFATAGTAEKCRACEELGADRAINYRDEDFVEIIKEQTEGAGVDVILDMVGADYVQKNIDALALEGRCVNVAYQNGFEANVNFLPVLLKRLTLTGSTLRARSVEQKGAIADALRAEVWPLFGDGTLKPVVDSTYPLQEAGEAHRRMEASKHIGKILLCP